MFWSWLERVQAILTSAAKPLAVVADERFGLPYVLAELAAAGRVVWVHLWEGDDLDRVATGNRLAEALNRYAGTRLYDLGHPARALLATLEAEGPPRVTLVVSGAEHNPELALRLGRVWGYSSTILAGAGLALEVSARVGAAELALTWPEARQGAQELGELPEGQVRSFWEEAEGAYEPFRQRLHEALGYPPLLRPYPDGPRPSPASAGRLEPQRWLTLLLRQDRLTEAFALAVKHAPETALAIAEAAVEAFLKRGEYAQLAVLLEELMARYPEEAVLLRGWYEAQVGLGRSELAAARVRVFLEQREDPDLEALLALFSGEARTPWERAATPYTLLAKGVVEWRRSRAGAGECAPSTARAARLAAERGKGRLAVVAATRTARLLLAQGRYREALFWAEWALEGMETHGVYGANERLNALSAWAQARALLGKTEGVTSRLERARAWVGGASPKLKRRFCETLAHLYLAIGEAGRAVALWEAFFREWPDLPHRARYGGGYALALWAAGEDAAAQVEAERAAALARPLVRRRDLFSHTALAALLSEQEPQRALEVVQDLEPALKQPGFCAGWGLRLWLSAAAARTRLGEGEAAGRALRRARPYLQDLAVPAGLAFVLGKAAAFAEVVAGAGSGERLELHLLGDAPRVLWRGRPLRLSLRSLELLVALVLRGPRSGEALMLDVYGDAGNLNRLKVAVAKLRASVPLRSRPYALAVPVWADFLEVERLLAAGRLREAVALYRGPLLPRSTAPVVMEQRGVLEELLRQTALAHPGDPAALEVAVRLGDDLELWEAVLRAMDRRDPQAALAAAQVQRLRAEWGG
ncbi:hypothetical protein [Marinithermus hydrothermalis]|uniref:Transcriptional regulator domain-containing protein n=1 Tax=Marinithermus hydrothermalis (strain DSM 14884 / JCM 11576 / T1) TaxID=869210 RepID=F2NPP8_MARHT|nr:hypothetical protein [Marinithermus hydrothermalis]AEB12824.1 transcriptional regulator domain-containing protein [Marinithermus hydrothermalis DSM 14884]